MQLSKNNIIFIFLIYGVGLFLFQSKNNGFEPGHYGWVSSHVLSQAKKATPENDFLAYSYKTIEASGKKEYVYFDRYPVFFNSLFNFYLRTIDQNFSGEIYWARHFMNWIYLATLIVCFFLAQFFFKNYLISFVTVLIVFSGHDLLYFKDMIHYDQPGLLGFTLLLLALCYWETGKKSFWIYPVALFAVGFGRGYPSFLILAGWCILELQRNFKAKTYFSFFKSTAFKVSFLSFIFASLCLFYNISKEAQLRGVALVETSIVQSALKRTGASQLEPKLQEKAAFHRVFAKQYDRIARNLMPRIFVGNSSLDTDNRMLRNIFRTMDSILFLFFSFLTFKNFKEDRRRGLIIITVSTGFIWCMLMKNLTAFHLYTSMIYVPLLILLIGSAVKKLFAITQPRLVRPLLIFTFIIAIGSLYSIKSYHDLTLEPYNSMTQELEGIRAILVKENVEILGTDGRFSDFFTAAPYALAYYLGDYFFDRHHPQPFTLYKSKNGKGENLTPQNSYFFLYRSN